MALNTLKEAFRIFTKIHEYFWMERLITGVNDLADKREKFWDKKFFHILVRNYKLGVYTYIKKFFKDIHFEVQAG